MPLLLASHPACMAHDTGPGHPERPERLEAVEAGVLSSGIPVFSVEAPLIERSELALVHDPAYIEAIEVFCARGGGSLDMDTRVRAASWEAALRAAGAVRVLVDALTTEDEASGFALSRPPGHHAMPSRAMGFCLFNNVAVSVAVLRARGERVAVLDWDVHHGNGTQEMFADDPGVLYVSIHQSHHYPHGGMVGDIDDAESKGTTVNIPLPAGSAGDVYREAWKSVVLPLVRLFQPGWVFVSAGYDAHAADPLGDVRLVASDYGAMSGLLREAHPPNRTIFALEGGYDLDALHTSAAATVAGIQGGVVDAAPSGFVSPPQAAEALEHALTAISRHWKI